MYIGYPLSARDGGGLVTFGFILCAANNVNTSCSPLQYVEIVSEAVIRERCGNKFAFHVAETASVLQKTIERKGCLPARSIPLPFVFMDPAISMMADKAKAIDSIAIMITDLGIFKEQHISLAGAVRSGCAPSFIRERATA